MKRERKTTERTNTGVRNACALWLTVAAMMVPLLTGAADVVVSPKVVVGKIKPMNAVNNGPVKSGSSQKRDNFTDYKNCCIPFARTHDASFCASYGGEHTVDISAIFPDFTKDADDPTSYDFLPTDNYLKLIREAGTEVFFRLGQRIEHGQKKYNIYPPKDYQKWAEVAEHIIRHYNEGWANGFEWNIRYWEIWNEPDLDSEGDGWKKDPRTWGGSPEQFCDFYETAANHLNRCFPDLYIGGPAIAGNEGWGEKFLTYMEQHQVELDFFSWHIYSTSPWQIGEKAVRIREMMERHGYGKSESILNEWNYVKGWTENYPYSVETISNIKGAAFVAATFSVGQKTPVDMLMYYDARVGTVFNGLFDFNSYAPSPVYYAFYAWSKMNKLGTQIEAKNTMKGIAATAATDGKGRYAVMLTRYNDDNNVVAKKSVTLQFEGLEEGDRIVGHLTDSAHKYTEQPLEPNGQEIELLLEPNAFILIEIEKK